MELEKINYICKIMFKKEYFVEIPITFKSDNRPFWEIIGYKNEDEFIDSLVMIDGETGKVYDTKGNEIKDYATNKNK